jgi:hypothetical protein
MPFTDKLPERDQPAMCVIHKSGVRLGYTLSLAHTAPIDGASLACLH